MFTKNELTLLTLLQSAEQSTFRSLLESSGLARSSAHVALEHLLAIGVVTRVDALGQRHPAVFRLAPTNVLEAAANRAIDDFRQAVFPSRNQGRKPRLVFTDKYQLAETEIRQLRTRYDVTIYDQSPPFMTDELFALRAAGAEIVVRYDTPTINDEMLRKLPKLKTVVCPTANLYNIDVAACKQRSIDMHFLDADTEPYATHSQVEYALNALFTLHNPLVRVANEVQYTSGFQHQEPGGDLMGSKIGLLFGRSDISKLVATLRALDCHVAAASVAQAPREAMFCGLTGYTDIEELWQWADAALIFNGASVDLDSLLRLPRMPSYLIICTERATYDQQLMREQIIAGRLKGLMLDALPNMFRERLFDEHPQKSMHPLINLPNVFVTPETSVRSKNALARNKESIFTLLMNLKLADSS